MRLNTDDGADANAEVDLRGSWRTGSGDAASVESVRVQLLEVPLRPYMRYTGYDVINIPFVTVRDTDGAESSGFTYTLDDGAAMVCHMVSEVVGPALVGRSISEWDAVRRQIETATRRLGAHVFTAALSAVDIAVWDLRGIRAGMPLFALLGGKLRSVPFYGSGRGGRNATIAEVVSQSTAYLEDGYCGVKFGVGGRDRTEDLDRMAAVRHAVGTAELMVDASERLSRDNALWLGRRCEELSFRWIEEPLPAEDVSGYAALASELNVPVATGEHLQGRGMFERYLRETAVATYQPDAALGGGVTEMIAVAELAAVAGRSLAWHSLADLHIHLAVCAAGTEYVEDFPILAEIIAEPLAPVKGRATPSGNPGHGIVWDRARIASASTRQWP
jgi:L-alanine-DL-glutamate epimerase-like enolase superfamily enzyme